jgi:D-glycero-alpha-D-manno-heptose-7-phosphate kinase
MEVSEVCDLAKVHSGALPTVRRVRARAPLRVGLAGGGTDVPPYCDVFEGGTISATINRYTYAFVSISPSQHTIVESLDFMERGCVECGTVRNHHSLRLAAAALEHVSQLLDGGHCPPLQIRTWSLVPAGSGLGSSSSLTVALVRALTVFLGLEMDRNDIALASYSIERDRLGLACGGQDHFAAAYGGFLRMRFAPGRKISVRRLGVSSELVSELEARLALYFTGRTREPRVARGRIESISDLGRRIEPLHVMYRQVNAMENALLAGDCDRIAKLIGDAAEAKKGSSEDMLNEQLVDIEERAARRGCTATKVSGSGGGGFMLLVTEPENMHAVRSGIGAESGYFIEFGFTTSGVSGWVA